METITYKFKCGCSATGNENTPKHCIAHGAPGEDNREFDVVLTPEPEPEPEPEPAAPKAPEKQEKPKDAKG